MASWQVGRARLSAHSSSLSKRLSQHKAHELHSEVRGPGCAVSLNVCLSVVRRHSRFTNPQAKVFRKDRRFLSTAYYYDTEPAKSGFAQCLWLAVKRASGTNTKKIPITKMKTALPTICIPLDRNTSCGAVRRPPLSLHNLPPELHLLLFSFLEYDSLLKLGATNKRFHSIICREHIVAALYRAEDIVRDPSNPRKQRLACFRCYRLRSAFFDFDCRGIQPKFTAQGKEAGRRRCLICLMPSSPQEKAPASSMSGKRWSGTRKSDDDQSNKHQGPGADL